MKLLLYCTKSKKQLVKWEKYMYGTNGKNDKFNSLNGKIVAECDFEVEKIYHYIHHEPEVNIGLGILSSFDCDAYCTDTLDNLDLEECSCLYDLNYYLCGDGGYAIHIKNLHIFDKPKELSDYYTFDNKQHININYCKPITKAPQNMMYCWELWQDHSVIGNRYFYKNILISIQPQWLCKILNGEKTIEVRRKVLKEMIK